MKITKLPRRTLAKRRRRKTMLLWQGKQFTRFELFRLARMNYEKPDFTG